MLDPDEFLPVGVHEGYRKNLTEMFCGKAGIEKIDPASMSRLPNLEVLWLNDNMLSKLQGLDFNFRLKHLYIHNNSITTLCNASCCITKLRHLETLQLQGNQLQDLKATLAVLSQLHSLRKLGLGNNPLALEGSYREATIFAIPSLEHLDSSVVTPIERQAAVKFFTAKRIEKKYAFGTIPRIWDKPAFINIGDPSVGELQLRTEIRASTRRRQAAAEEKQAVELREASRPRFEVSYASGSTGLLSAQAGASTIGEKAFEFVARGRVPHLLVKLGFLTMKSAAKATAVAMDQKAGQGDPEQVKVHVAVSAMGVLKSPLISRDVICAQLEEDDEAAFLRCEEFLFDPLIYADAYDKVQQLRQMGKTDEINVSFALRESSSGQTIGVARVPLMAILEEHVEKQYNFEQTPLYPPRRGGGMGAALPADTPVAHLSLSLTTDWGLSNTSGGEFGNSAFEFERRRRTKAGAKHRPEPSPGAVAAQAAATSGLTKRLARDCVILKSLQAPSKEGADSGQAALAAIDPAGFKFDAVGYEKFLAAKATLQPRGRSETTIPL